MLLSGGFIHEKTCNSDRAIAFGYADRTSGCLLRQLFAEYFLDSRRLADSLASSVAEFVGSLNSSNSSHLPQPVTKAGCGVYSCGESSGNCFLGSLLKNSFCCHPERSEGSVFGRKARKKTDSSSPAASRNDMNETFQHSAKAHGMRAGVRAKLPRIRSRFSKPLRLELVMARNFRRHQAGPSRRSSTFGLSFLEAAELFTGQL
jgi:hypothetical protein